MTDYVPPGVSQEIAAQVVAHGRPGRWQWKLQECIYCGKTHYHGAGTGPEPALLGHRLAHCLATDLEKRGLSSRPGYVLVLQEVRA